MMSRLGAFFLDILQVLIFAVSIFLFIYLLVLQPHKIKGASMEPNFHDGEFLLTDKVTYRFGEPKRGDVVVFKAPPDESNEFIKRIIAVPGERVKIEGGRVYINGQMLEEEYLDPALQTNSGSVLAEGQEYTIPAEQYVMLGDNRNHSLDSRNIGFIGKDKITGRAWLLYWPLNLAGTVKAPNYNF